MAKRKRSTLAKVDEVVDTLSEELIPIKKPRGPIKFKIELNEEQKEAKRLVLENRVTIITGKTGSGKAQPLTSKILTPCGWTTMGELKVNDLVIGVTGKSTRVTGIFPQGKKEIFKVSFSDGSSTLCCGEHLWNVKTHRLRNKWRGKHSDLEKVETEYITLSIKQIREDLFLKDRLNYSIPMVDPVEFDKQELPIDPYVLGLLLGDGSFRQNISFSSMDEELIDTIKKYAADVNCILKEKKQISKAREFYFTGESSTNYILDTIKKLELFDKKSEEKEIPHTYKFSSVEDRVELLRGLMDTDGSTTGKSTTFHTSSEKLKNDVVELIRSLGGIATYSSKTPKYKYKGQVKTGLTCYSINVCLSNINPFNLSRKKDKYVHKTKYVPTRYITGIEACGEMSAQCISVDATEQLYVTDEYIVTHNTQVAVITALDLLFKKEIEKIYITRPLVTREDMGFLPGDISEKMDPFLAPIYDNINNCYNGTTELKKMIADKKIDIAPIAYMRGRTIKDGILIIDEAQNMDHESLKMCLTRIGKTGKIVICGDAAQIDLKQKNLSGLSFIVSFTPRVKNMEHIELKINHRDEIVDEILTQYELKEEQDKINSFR